MIRNFLLTGSHSIAECVDQGSAAVPPQRCDLFLQIHWEDRSQPSHPHHAGISALVVRIEIAHYEQEGVEIRRFERDVEGANVLECICLCQLKQSDIEVLRPLADNK